MDAQSAAAARIDLAAIRANVALLRERARDAAVMAVVKADGYGHGMLPSARAAVEAGAQWLGTAFLTEALALRRAGVDKPRVLAWLAAPGEDYAPALAANVDVAASAPWQLAEIVAAATTEAPARVHLKVDSGLGRSGATPADWPELVEAALRAEDDGRIRVVGLWSHLACADTPSHPANQRQLDEFGAAVELARKRGICPEVCHLANSAATLSSPQTHFDLVRVGLAAYGLSPMPAEASAAELGLTPAMTVRAPLALVKRVSAGHGVSYGHHYHTSGVSTLGLVPLGYADGVPRAGSNTGPVWAAGRRRRVVGTVCMDQFCLDLGDDPAAAGDEVVVFGPGVAGEPTAQEWAELTDTISYEIVTRIGPRLPRLYDDQYGQAEPGESPTWDTDGATAVGARRV